MVKCLQGIQLDVSINCCYLHQDPGKNWITGRDHNATHYINFNALPHLLPYIFFPFNIDRPQRNALPRFYHVTTCVTVLFSRFNMVGGIFATGYHAIPSIFSNKLLIYIFL